MEKRCVYCKSQFSTLEDVIDHCFAIHRDQDLKFLSLDIHDGKKVYRTVKYPVKPEDIERDKLLIDSSTLRLAFAKPAESKSTQSPHTKLQKINIEPHSTNSSKCLFPQDNVNITDNQEIRDENEIILQRFVELLPSAIPQLKESGNLELWLQFIKLVGEGEFPMENICLKLFLDVVKFYSGCDIYAMRYANEVKLFWTLGYILFKGKFLRFMGGIKSAGQLEDNSRTELIAQDSHINFCVPNSGVLRSVFDDSKLECENPGIFEDVLDKFAQDHKIDSCKVAIDGKRLNSGFGKHLGDVDLFGHENEPTLCDRKQRLASEQSTVETILNLVSELDKRQKTTLSKDVPSAENLVTLIHETLKNISFRIKDIRQLRLKKTIALQNLKQTAG